jgi:hypothetical protein
VVEHWSSVSRSIENFGGQFFLLAEFCTVQKSDVLAIFGDIARFRFRGSLFSTSGFFGAIFQLLVFNSAIFGNIAIFFAFVRMQKR